MMKKLFDPLFCTYCLLWGFIHLFRWIGYPIPFLNDYLTDFLFVPVVAHIALMVIRAYVLRDAFYAYPVYYLLLIACYSAIIFEWIMPAVSTVYTRDYGDVVAYFLGGMFYYYVHQRVVMRVVWI